MFPENVCSETVQRGRCARTLCARSTTVYEAASLDGAATVPANCDTSSPTGTGSGVERVSKSHLRSSPQQGDNLWTTTAKGPITAGNVVTGSAETSSTSPRSVPLTKRRRWDQAMSRMNSRRRSTYLYARSEYGYKGLRQPKRGNATKSYWAWSKPVGEDHGQGKAEPPHKNGSTPRAGTVGKGNAGPPQTDERSR